MHPTPPRSLKSKKKAIFLVSGSSLIGRGQNPKIEIFATLKWLQCAHLLYFPVPSLVRTAQPEPSGSARSMPVLPVRTQPRPHRRQPEPSCSAAQRQCGIARPAPSRPPPSPDPIISSLSCLHVSSQKIKNFVDLKAWTVNMKSKSTYELIQYITITSYEGLHLLWQRDQHIKIPSRGVIWNASCYAKIWICNRVKMDPALACYSQMLQAQFTTVH